MASKNSFGDSRLKKPFRHMKHRLTRNKARQISEREHENDSVGPSHRTGVVVSPSNPPSCEVCHHLKIEKDGSIGAWVDTLFQSGDNGCTCCSMLSAGILLFLKDARDSHERVSISEFMYADGNTLLLMFPDRILSTLNPIWKITFSFPEGMRFPITSCVLKDDPSSDYSSAESINHQLRLVEECDRTHHCVEINSAPKLPKRIIDIGTEDDEILKLHCPEIEERARYVALSHCWGASSIFCTDTLSYKERREGFKFEDLPQTFRDAVSIARKLKVRYLWIDSVCIIQQDRQDWETESARMANYYANAYLTIAATRASDSTVGFLGPAESRRTRILKCEHSEQSFDVIIQESHDTNPTAERGNRLYTRAWAFQETLVSPRVLSYAAAELEWYCKDSTWCECVYLVPLSCRSRPIKAHSGHWAKLRDNVTRAKHHEWLLLIKEFSERQLTRQSDRLPALSALAEHFYSNLKGPYIAGLWNIEGDIWEGLRWSTHGVGSLPLAYRAPSWSWASVEGRISYDSYPRRYGGVKLLEAKTQLQTANPFGEVVGGSLLLSGSLVKARLDVALQKYGWEDQGSYELTPLVDIADLKVSPELKVAKRDDIFGDNSGPRFYTDTSLELQPIDPGTQTLTHTLRRSAKPSQDPQDNISGLVYCLRFTPEEKLIHDGGDSVWMIVLGCVDATKGIYERIGMTYMAFTDQTKPFFAEIRPSIITII